MRHANFGSAWRILAVLSFAWMACVSTPVPATPDAAMPDGPLDTAVTNDAAVTPNDAITPNDAVTPDAAEADGAPRADDAPGVRDVAFVPVLQGARAPRDAGIRVCEAPEGTAPASPLVQEIRYEATVDERGLYARPLPVWSVADDLVWIAHPGLAGRDGEPAAFTSARATAPPTNPVAPVTRAFMLEIP